MIVKIHLDFTRLKCYTVYISKYTVLTKHRQSSVSIKKYKEMWTFPRKKFLGCIVETLFVNTESSRRQRQMSSLTFRCIRAPQHFPMLFKLNIYSARESIEYWWAQCESLVKVFINFLTVDLLSSGILVLYRICLLLTPHTQYFLS